MERSRLYSDASEEITTHNEISEVAINGKRHQLYTRSASQIRKAEFTQLQAAVSHIANVAQKENIVRLKGHGFRLFRKSFTLKVSLPM